MSHPTAPRLSDGGTVVCLATGPSLTQADVDYCRGKVDAVIAVNDAWRLCPWANVLYSSDRTWWTHYTGVPAFQGLKYGLGSAVGKRNPFSGLPEIRVLRNSGYTGIDTDPGCLRNGRNSGFAAVNLAVHLGAARIVLLGYNMGRPGSQAHFFGDHPVGLRQSHGLYPTWRRLFLSMVEPLADLGIDVINCTPQTSLDAFPVADLRDVLPSAYEMRSGNAATTVIPTLRNVTAEQVAS